MIVEMTLLQFGRPSVDAPKLGSIVCQWLARVLLVCLIRTSQSSHGDARPSVSLTSVLNHKPKCLAASNQKPVDVILKVGP